MKGNIVLAVLNICAAVWGVGNALSPWLALINVFVAGMLVDLIVMGWLRGERPWRSH